MTDPIDDSQPQSTTDTATDPTVPGPVTAATGKPAVEPAVDPAVDPGRPLRVDPARPSDPAWREPAWFPPRDDRGQRREQRERRSGSFAIIVGLVLIAIGAWSFLQTTLGIDLPRIRWGSLWPVILIVIGGLMLVRSLQRRP